MDNRQGFMARLCSEAQAILRNNKDGVAIVQVTILLERNGNPRLWWINQSARIEPSGNAKEVLGKILGDSS